MELNEKQLADMIKRNQANFGFNYKQPILVLCGTTIGLAVLVLILMFKLLS